MKQSTPMKRTAFARKVPMSYISKKVPGKTDKAARIKHKKKESSIFRSDAYLALVRTIPCVMCGIQHLTQAAHSNQLAFGKARGMKASDASAMALCASTQERNGCHAVHDQGGKLSKAEWKAVEYQNIVATVMTLMNHHKWTFMPPDITTKIPDSSTMDFELMAVFLVGVIERGELQIACTS